MVLVISFLFCFFFSVFMWKVYNSTIYASRRNYPFSCRMEPVVSCGKYNLQIRSNKKKCYGLLLWFHCKFGKDWWICVENFDFFEDFFFLFSLCYAVFCIWRCM